MSDSILTEKPQAVDKNELDTNIRVSGRWLAALETCTFHGRHAADIAGLVDFLTAQYRFNKEQLDKAIEAEGLKAKVEFGPKVAA